MKRTLVITLLLMVLLQPFYMLHAKAEDSSGNQAVFTAVTEDGKTLFSRGGSIYEGDEYISSDNTLYRIKSVDGSKATAETIGPETMPDVSWLDTGEAQAVFAAAETANTQKKQSATDKRLIAMYVTHSDESYIKGDGTQSIEGQGGIYDVARSFKESLQKLGIDVILDESTHLPHDSGAYRRSRRTAERLLQNRPDAILDIHRDGIPDQSEYTCSINGENASQVRLLVGRGNQNSAVNREFAKQIKAIADKKYPNLIKDIFIGKGTYNQDLSPNAILLEFGTHTISKERVLNSADEMAHVVSTALYGDTTGSAKQNAVTKKTQDTKQNKRSVSSLALMIGIVIIAALLFALLQTGGGKAMGTKIKRGIHEMTGGMIGKKNTKDTNPPS